MAVPQPSWSFPRVRFPRPHAAVAFPLSLCWMVCLGFPFSVARAEIRGDVELLKKAATDYRANLDRIKTWQGEVEYTQESNAIKATVVVCRIEFAWDKAAKMHSWDIQTTKDVEVVDGREKPRLTLTRNAGFCRDGAYYEVGYPIDTAKNVRIGVVVRSQSRMGPGFHYGYFEPWYFLGQDGHELDKDWLLVYDHAKDPVGAGSVSREGNRVTFVQERPGEKSPEGPPRMTTILDLSQRPGIQSIETTSHQNRFAWAWTWRETSGVWVPEEVAKSTIANGEPPSRRHFHLRWKKSVVNEPIPPETFSIKRLVAGHDYGLWDARTDREKAKPPRAGEEGRKGAFQGPSSQ